MSDELNTKSNELRGALGDLGRRLREGDDSNLLVWVIPGALAVAHRPLRHHPRYGGSGRDLPAEATSEVVRWVRRMYEVGILSIISLMHPKELLHYAQLNFGADSLIEFYRQMGFEVRHIPWEDPAHRSALGRFTFQEELIRIREEALRAFDDLPKPVLLHCSAGIDRSSPVAAYIWARRKGLRNSFDET